MPEGAKETTAPQPAHARPLSPHLQIYGWTVTMATSIVHRATGVALAVGSVFLVWWLLAAASGPDAYGVFAAAAGHALGRLVLFGFVWSLAFHLLNGIRHLAWDAGYGYAPRTANLIGALIIVLSVLIALGVFVLGYVVKGDLAP